MNGCHGVSCQGSLNHSPVFNGHPEILSQQRLRSSCTQADEHSWSDEFYLLFQPWQTGGDFPSARLLMESTLTLRDPLEVLHDIRHVCLIPIDSGFSKGFFQYSARWKRPVTVDHADRESRESPLRRRWFQR